MSDVRELAVDDRLSELLLSLYEFAGDAARGPDFLALLGGAPDLMEQLSPHLDLAAQISARQRRWLDVTAIAFDGRGHLLGDQDISGLPSGLAPGGLESVVAGALDQLRSRSQGESVLVPFFDEGGEGVALLVDAHRADWTEAVELPAGARFVLLLPPKPDAGDAEPISGALTPAESRVALSIARGVSIAEVARRQGTSVNTVRNQLKSVYAKTGFNSQGQLIVALGQLAALTRRLRQEQTLRMDTRQHLLPDGRTLAWERRGPADGLPVVFCHAGFGMTEVSASEMTQLDRSGIACYSLLRPGFGASSALDDYSVEQVAKDAHHWLEAMGIERCVIHGSASGARHALALAERAVERVAAVFITNGRVSLPPPSDNVFLRSYRSLAHAPWIVDLYSRIATNAIRLGPVRDFVLASLTESDADRVAMSEPQALDQLVRGSMAAARDSRRGIADDLVHLSGQPARTPVGLTMPVHVWHGAQDRLADPQPVLALLSELPDLRFRLLADAGHLVAVTHHRELVEAFAHALTSGVSE